MTSTGVPFAIACPWARCVEAITSSRSSARTRRSRTLLADRDVQEPGKLTRPEAILHLLLEPANQEHLAEEPAQHLSVILDAPRNRPAPHGVIERPLC